jgi:hypothetical protein
MPAPSNRGDRGRTEWVAEGPGGLTRPRRGKVAGMPDTNASWRRRLATCGCALAIAVFLNACSSESATRREKTSKLDCSSQVAAGGDSGETDVQGSAGGRNTGAGSSSASQSASGKAGSTPSSPVEDVPTPSASDSATSPTSRGSATDDCGNYKTGNDTGSGAQGGVNG